MTILLFSSRVKADLHAFVRLNGELLDLVLAEYIKQKALGVLHRFWVAILQ